MIFCVWGLRSLKEARESKEGAGVELKSPRMKMGVEVGIEWRKEESWERAEVVVC